MLNINLTGLTAQFVHVRILNQLGQTVYQNQFGADGSLNTVIVFDQKLSAGMYFAEFILGDETLREAFVVQK
jgi:hypothetical protein